MGWFTDACLSIVMSKQAREAFKARRAATKTGDREPLKEHPMTPERAALLDNAMKVYRDKQAVLASLKGEDKEKLAALALKSLLNEGDGKKK